jgi:cobalt-precorrin-5B (C1)-methyltransferase
MGDFVGYALEECARKKLARVTIWGMVGKLSKVAHGDLYTNTDCSKVDVGFLAGVATSCDVPQLVVAASAKAVTAHHFLKIVGEDNIKRLCDRLCLLAAERCRNHAGGVLEVACVMSDYDGTVLGRACVEG